MARALRIQILVYRCPYANTVDCSVTSTLVGTKRPEPRLGVTKSMIVKERMHSSFARDNYDLLLPRFLFNIERG